MEILVLGAGPAAVASALLLWRQGHAVKLIGVPRREDALEGVSARAIEGLRRLGCARALAALDARYERIAAWGGSVAAANSEHVVCRRRLDSALLADLEEAGVPWRDARVLSVRRSPRGAWRVAHGEGVAQADLLIDGRGSAAPSAGAVAQAAPLALALSAPLDGCGRGRRTTIAESFADGWAWCAAHGDGRAQVQVVVDPERLPAQARRALPALHAELRAQLPLISDFLGPSARPCGPVRVRAIRPRLSAGPARPGLLRVGDAAASCDPLSGHGLFEALGSAFAAAPVANTLLAQPASAPLALRYHAERSADRFQENEQRARTLYQRETRWASRPFWARRAAGAGREQAPRPGIVLAPVVEDGVIVEREVVVSAAHPRGVRFVGSVELARLCRLIEAAPGGGDPARLAPAVDAPPRDVAAAWVWLHAAGLLPKGA